MIRSIFYITFLLLGCRVSAQFNQNYAHYLLNPALQNPGFIAYNEEPEVAFTWRQQWTGIDGAPSTQWLSYGTRFRDNKNCIGGYIAMDRIGVSQQIKFAPGYAHEFKLNKKWKFALGVNAGFSLISHKWTELNVQDNTDEFFNQNAMNQVRPNFSFGARFNSDSFFAGFSLPELFDQNTAELSIQKESTQIQFFSGYKFHFSHELTFTPGLALKTTFNQHFQYDLNLMANYNRLITMGLSYRYQDAMGFLFGMYLNKQFRFAYNYELNNSKLSNYSKGSHELSLMYQFSYHKPSQNPRFF